MIITIASGKGGTGKTTIAVNLALSVGVDVQLLDCDVEEPNAHLFIKPKFETTETVVMPIPLVDEEKCTLCGKCGEICQFKAIVAIAGGTVLTFPELCHGCGGCVKVCPEGAITETSRELGIIQKGWSGEVEFIHGRLNVGEAMSPPLIEKVRLAANPDKLVIVDAPPGTSCPVISAMKGVDFVILVTEPTPFGLHDLKLAAGAVKLLGIPHGLVINRSDMGNDEVIKYAEKENIPILMEIPFDRQIAEIYSKGEIIVDAMPQLKEKFVELYHRIKNTVTGGVA